MNTFNYYNGHYYNVISTRDTHVYLPT